jgi:hypothetical protein
MKYVDSVRSEVDQQCRDRKCVELIQAKYAATDYSKLFPPQAAARYQADPELKLLEDELRFLIHCSFTELENEPYDAGKLSEIVNMIGEYMHKMSGTDEEKRRGRKLLNNEALRFAVAPSDKIEAVRCFVKSTCFMHIPLPRSENDKWKKSHTELRPSPELKGIWNIDLINQQNIHHRIVDGTARADSDLESILAKLDPKLADSIRSAVASSSNKSQ